MFKLWRTAFEDKGLAYSVDGLNEGKLCRVIGTNGVVPDDQYYLLGEFATPNEFLDAFRTEYTRYADWVRESALLLCAYVAEVEYCRSEEWFHKLKAVYEFGESMPESTGFDRETYITEKRAASSSK